MNRNIYIGFRSQCVKTTSKISVEIAMFTAEVMIAPATQMPPFWQGKHTADSTFTSIPFSISLLSPKSLHFSNSIKSKSYFTSLKALARLQQLSLYSDSSLAQSHRLIHHYLSASLHWSSVHEVQHSERFIQSVQSATSTSFTQLVPLLPR